MSKVSNEEYERMESFFKAVNVNNASPNKNKTIYLDSLCSILKEKKMIVQGVKSPTDATPVWKKTRGTYTNTKKSIKKNDIERTYNKLIEVQLCCVRNDTWNFRDSTTVVFNAEDLKAHYMSNVVSAQENNRNYEDFDFCNRIKILMDYYLCPYYKEHQKKDHINPTLCNINSDDPLIYNYIFKALGMVILYYMFLPHVHCWSIDMFLENDKKLLKDETVPAIVAWDNVLKSNYANVQVAQIYLTLINDTLLLKCSIIQSWYKAFGEKKADEFQTLKEAIATFDEKLKCFTLKIRRTDDFDDAFVIENITKEIVSSNEFYITFPINAFQLRRNYAKYYYLFEKQFWIVPFLFMFENKHPFQHDYQSDLTTEADRENLVLFLIHYFSFDLDIFRILHEHKLIDKICARITALYSLDWKVLTFSSLKSHLLACLCIFKDINPFSIPKSACVVSLDENNYSYDGVPFDEINIVRAKMVYTRYVIQDRKAVIAEDDVISDKLPKLVDCNDDRKLFWMALTFYHSPYILINTDIPYHYCPEYIKFCILSDQMNETSFLLHDAIFKLKL